MKAFLGVDTARQFFLWEEAVVKEINPKLDLTEIPDNLWDQYMRVSLAYLNIQKQLEELYKKQT